MALTAWPAAAAPAARTLPVTAGADGVSMAPMASLPAGGAGGRGGQTIEVVELRGLDRLQRQMAGGQPWMRAGVSSFAHSARSTAMASRSRRNSLLSLATRAACNVESNLIL